ncbi:MAG: 1-acyl-sn-glycerol-3-phosphate acyltransferase [Salinibacter sp.]|uniref:1-acyl-sn-glycerol-3-phosphate acyltransferase n=1 Tax=Salinibacter sp. TaxID=2065818 RepID=UPI0035D45B1B
MPDLSTPDSSNDSADRPERGARAPDESPSRSDAGRNDRCLLIAGRQQSDPRSDLSVALRQPDGNESIRLLAYLIRKAMRWMADRVTVDWPSFKRAVDARPPQALPVLIPTHRSYLDFLLTSYLLFVRPELGLSVPHTPATQEFEDMWIVGRLLERARAFYIERGAGCAQFSINQKLEALDDPDATLMFFVEGGRSRSRRFLSPQMGLLQALKRTGRYCHILPLSIAYDRVPEQRELETELRGHPKSQKTLSGLLRWTGRLVRNDIDLGHIHLCCGRPLTLNEETDVPTCANIILARHRANMAVTRYHLQCFVDRADPDGVDVEDIAEMIDARGGRVLDSTLAGRVSPSRLEERSYRFQWMHLLYPDAQQLYGDHPVVRHHLQFNHHDVDPSSDPPAADDRVRAIVAALFEPIAATYRRVGRRLARADADDLPTPSDFFGDRHGFKPYVEEAYEAFVEEGILAHSGSAEHQWARGPRFNRLSRFLERCRLPSETEGTPAASSL